MKTLRPSLRSPLRSIFFAAALACAGSALANASNSPDDIAQRLTALSLAGTPEPAAGDPRVLETRKLLDKAVKQTREEPLAVAAACQRYVGHLHDSAQIRATPLELLAALVAHGKAGQPMSDTLQSCQPMSDTLQSYVAARKAAPGRTHGEAMSALAARR